MNFSAYPTLAPLPFASPFVPSTHVATPTERPRGIAGARLPLPACGKFAHQFELLEPASNIFLLEFIGLFWGWWWQGNGWEKKINILFG